MSIRSDSYGSTAEVQAFTQYLAAGQTAFNSTTQPTLTQVEKFIDRASGILNTALAGAGIATPITNGTAKLACDDWVTARATEYVELTQRGSGYSDAEGNRHNSFRNMQKAATDFAKENRLGFFRLGVTAAHNAAEGLQFTGQTAPADRADPDDTGLAQPAFRRGLFDYPGVDGSEDED